MVYTTTNLIVSGIVAEIKCDNRDKAEALAKKMAAGRSVDLTPPIYVEGLPPDVAAQTNNVEVIAFDPDFKRKVMSK